VLPVLPFNARCHHCLASSSPFHTPPLAIGPRCHRSRLSAAHAESPAPRRPPLSRGNGAAHTRRSGANADHSSCHPSRPGPPLPQYFSPPHGAKPRTPLPPFSSLLTPLGRDKSYRRPCSPFLPIFLLHLLRALPPPSSPLSLSTLSPGRLTASPPEVRATHGIESPPPRYASPPCIVAHKWLAPHPLPSPLALQDPVTSATRDRIASATMGHRRAASAPPLHVESLLG
jgi:hypothetical protein